MSEPAAIAGGPADGLATASGARFVWLEVVVRKRPERTPTAGLYELRDGRYEYVGAGGAVCGCGAVFDRTAAGVSLPCPLCGAAPEVEVASDV